MFGIPLLLGFGSVVFRRFAASLFAVFAIYQIANILIGKSNCDCFGYSVPSLLVLTIDLLSMASLVFSSVASHANPKGSVSRLRIRVGVVAVLGALIAFAFPLSPKMLLPGVLENGGADKQTIDLETLIQQDHPPQFRELLSDPPDFDGRSGDILIVRANCDSCQDFVDKWQLESTTIKDKNNSILLVSVRPEI